ncbi:MmyB family transcriptional regulator [Actinoplanes sp. RD1]|uniref:MmyB family transcriptional regulator n=1 Tax=Actinoplanes sp. RD1 TaxID=3064538 RepID=UPI00274269FC|nr:transcriptional regulator [Actinoplanes sp. RD1]
MDERTRYFRQLRRLRGAARRWSVIGGGLTAATAVLTPYAGIGVADAAWAAGAGTSVMLAWWRWRDHRELAAIEPPPPPPALQPGDRLLALAGLVAPGRGTVPAHITPGVHRLLDRLSGTPVAVYDAAWTLITANPLWAALMGDPTARRGRERNVLWQHFFAPSDRVDPDPSLASSMVADLRAAATRYPADGFLSELIAELRAASAEFRRLWEAGAVVPHESSRKTIHHPQVGELELDCDVLTVPGSDLRIVAYTAEPGTAACDRLALLSVVGQQQFAV